MVHICKETGFDRLLYATKQSYIIELDFFSFFANVEMTAVCNRQYS